MPAVFPGQGLEATAGLVPKDLRIDGAVVFRFDTGRAQLIKVSEVRAPGAEFAPAPDAVTEDETAWTAAG